MDSCASGHGPTGKGDGLDKPEDESGRPIQVRDLTSGAFRGGTAPPGDFQANSLWRAGNADAGPGRTAG